MKNSANEKRKMLLTGISGNIGKFIATEFSKKDWLIIGLDKNENSVSEQNENIQFSKCDLSNFSETEILLNKLDSKHGAFDVVVNCAGWIANSPVVTIADQELISHDFALWNDIIVANLYTTFNVSTLSVKNMIKNRKKGVIINFSSISANGNPGQSAYSAAKAGINAFTKTLAKELGPLGIRAVSIAPGFFETESTIQNVPADKLNKLTSSIPLKKLGQLTDIVKTIEYVIDTDYINGKTIELDGGLVI